jgi:hypothetical protein
MERSSFDVFEVLSWHLDGVTYKNMKTVVMVTSLADQDSNLKPPEYEVLP